MNGGERTQALCRLASLDLGALPLRCDATRARQNRASQIGSVFSGLTTELLGGICDVGDGAWSLFDRTCPAVFSRASLWPVMSDQL